jgi:hypothetical protein
MRRHGQPRQGDGTAWLVVDRVAGDYLCYWYTGTGDGRLAERARAATAEDAIAWGRQRTPRVRIRTADARSYWAGITPRPQGFAHIWGEAEMANIVSLPRIEAPSQPANRASIRNDRTQPSEHRRPAGVGHVLLGGASC